MSMDQDRLAQLRADIDNLVTEAKQISENRKAAEMSAEDIARLEEIESLVTWKREQCSARASGPPDRGRRRSRRQAAGQRRTAPLGVALPRRA